VDPVPDPLLLRKSGSAGDRTRDLCICSQKLWPLDHRGGQNVGLQFQIIFSLPTSFLWRFGEWDADLFEWKIEVFPESGVYQPHSAKTRRGIICFKPQHEAIRWNKANFDVLLTVHLSVFISVINQLDAQTFCFIISLFHASTCFEQHVLIIKRSKLHYTASGIIRLVGGRLVHRCTCFDLLMMSTWCSKHVGIK